MSLNLKHQGGIPGVAMSGMKVAPQEIDRYEIYSVQNMSISATWVGTPAVGTSGQSKALVLINKYLDYPRSLSYALAGSAGLGGTWTVNGYDQFGSAITETCAIGTATNGGTTNGTAIFSQVTSGTVSIATASEAGSGTGRLGVAIAANDYWFGLPCKIASTADVKRITHTGSGGIALTVAGTNSIGTLVSTTTHAFRGTVALTGTMSLTAMVVPTYENSKQEDMANLSQ